MKEYPVLRSKGLVVAVSDVHLGFIDESKRQDFLDFIDLYLAKQKIEYLVLLGDFLDFWRRTTLGAIYENRDVLDKLGRLDVGQILYVIGNHDFTAEKDLGGFVDFCGRESLQNLARGKLKFDVMFSIQSADLTFKFIHGYHTEYPAVLPIYESIAEELCQASDEAGKFRSDLWETITGAKLREKFREHLTKPPENRGSPSGLKELKRLLNGLWKNKRITKKDHKTGLVLIDMVLRENAKFVEPVKLKDEEFLVMGHTHKPGIEMKERIANTGCWVKNDHRYLIIENGKPILKRWV